MKANLLSHVLILAAAGLFSTGCSVKQMAMKELGNVLADGGTVFSADDDPELIRDAVPFSLKLMESVLASTPEHEALLLALSNGFMQYGYGFVEQQADLIEETDYDQATALRQRSVKLYKRARDYGMRGLEVRHAGFGKRLAADPAASVAEFKAEDVPLLYWTGVSWMAAVALSLDDPAMVGDLGKAEALLERAYALDPDWDYGALHSFFITYEISRMNGEGDPVERAKAHFQKANELTGGQMASVYVTYAEAVAVEQQDKELFVELLEKAAAVDLDQRPEWRLNNIIFQRRAKWLLTRMDWLFL